MEYVRGSNADGLQLLGTNEIDGPQGWHNVPAFVSLAGRATKKPEGDMMSSPTHSEGAARLFFLHIPKTGGVTLNAALENSFELSECQVHISPDDDEQFSQPSTPPCRFISGHAGPVATGAVAATHCRMTMLRHPVERFCSYAMHGYRQHREGVTEHAYRNVDHALGALREGLPQAYQNAFLCEALAAPVTRPWPVDRATLDQFAVVGLSSQQRRLLHLVSDCCGTLPMTNDWRLNVSSNREALNELSRRITPYLTYFAEDIETYRLAEQKFAERYATFVESLCGDVADPRMVTDDMVEQRLLDRHFDRWRNSGKATDQVRLDMTAPQPGSGWWWREINERLSYRWLGPELESTAYLPPVERRDYDLTIELVAIASGRILAELAISVAGHRVDFQFEEVSEDPHDVKYVLRGVVREDMLPPDGEPLTLKISCPEAIPALASNTISYASSTVGYDVRAVSLAVARLSLTPRSC
jgi:hypothetical protein